MIIMVDHIEDGIAEIGDNKINIDIGMIGRDIEIRNHNLIKGIGIGNTSHNVLLELDTNGTTTSYEDKKPIHLMSGLHCRAIQRQHGQHQRQYRQNLKRENAEQRFASTSINSRTSTLRLGHQKHLRCMQLFYLTTQQLTTTYSQTSPRVHHLHTQHPEAANSNQITSYRSTSRNTTRCCTPLSQQHPTDS